MSNFIKICETVCDIDGKVHFQPYARWVLLWISVPKNRNFQAAFNENHHYRLINNI
jgi:hypothetical protein